MKFMIALILISTSAAYADYGTIECKGTAGVYRLSLDEMSEITKETSHLRIGTQDIALASVRAQSSDFGLLSLTLVRGKGPGATKYVFKNLGSSKCFSVYESKQSGKARLEVINSMGVIGRADCKCSQD